MIAFARIRAWLAAAVLACAAWLVWRALRPYSLDEVMRSLGSIGLVDVGIALAFTVASFLCLSGSDALAVRYAGRKLPYRRIALASFTAISIGHVLGFAVVSSGALRYRFYTTWGLGRGDVGRILLFCGTTVVVGIATTAGIASLWQPDFVAAMFRVTRSQALAGGIVCIAAVAGYLALAAFVRRPLRIRAFRLELPRLPLALGQVLVGGTDQLMVAAALHRMLSIAGEVTYVPVAAAYATANAAAVVTHVPGGLGVIEAVVVSLVPGAEVLGAVLAFRAVYFLAPFPLGCLALLLAELARRRRRKGA